MDVWIWPQDTQCSLTWPEEGTVASDDPPVIKELFMQLERSPPWLPTGQILRTHLITGDSVLGTGSSRLRS